MVLKRKQNTYVKNWYFRQSNLFGNSNEIDKILSYTDLFFVATETESFGLRI
jgi:hypothetical protein